MACAIVSGYALDCKDTVGGIKNLYITELANITAVTENASGYVTAITKVAGKKYYLYALEPRGANSTTVNIQTDPKIGTVGYEQTIAATFLKMSFDTQYKLQQIIKNRTSIIVEMKSGQFFIFGSAYGMECTGGTGTSGAALNEFNGYSLTFAGMEKTFSQEVDPAIIAALLS
jgi:hypothetical protein